MKSRFLCTVMISLAIASLLGGCSGANLTSAWKQEGYTGKSANILVIGVADRQSRRQIFESTIAGKLRARGINAVPSYTIFPSEELTKQAIVNYSKANNIDSVIVTKVIDSKTVNQRVSHVTGGSSVRYPYHRNYNGWYGDYRYSTQSVVTYDTQYILTNLETNLYLLEAENMVWSVLVELESGNSFDAEINDLSDALVKQLVKDGLI